MMRLAGRLLALAAAAAMFTLESQVAFAGDGGWPRTIRHEAGEFVLKSPPSRIVSTSPSVTGILLAIGAPVVASAATTPTLLTDEKGFFSQWADVADARGVRVLYGSLTFDLEAVIGENPDLVVVSTTGADSVAQHYAELEAQGLAVMVVNYSTQKWQDIAAQLGRAVGREDAADTAIRNFDAYAADVAARLALPKGPVSIVGYNIAGSYSVARLNSPQAQVLNSLGFQVAGLPQSLAPQVTRRSDFDFISHENLSAAITGDTVFLLNGTDGDVERILADPLLANLPAIVNRRVYPLGPTSFRIDYYSGRQMIDAVARHFRKP